MKTTFQKALTGIGLTTGVLCLFYFCSILAATTVNLGATEAGMWATWVALLSGGVWLTWTVLGREMPARILFASVFVVLQVIASFVSMVYIGLVGGGIEFQWG